MADKRMASDGDIASLKTRVAHLEDNRRYIQNALEMVLSLEDFYTEIGGDNCSLDRLLPEAKRRIDAIFAFEVLAFYMVDETDLSFKPAFRYPEHLADMIQQEVNAMIEAGTFAWAIRERRGVMISSKDHSRQYLLHVIANHNQVKGMFGGLLPDGQTTLPDTAMTLLSIILLHVANAMESMAYTGLLKNQSQLLEKQVAERTRELTRSKRELETAMLRANALAEEAQAASRAKGDFLAKMSHELRTPLNGIIGMTEVALSTPLDDSQRQIVEIIGRESVSLLRQINDVLDFSKIESGKLELEQIDFNLRALIEEVGESFVFQTVEKGIDLNVFIDPLLPAVLIGDPVRLRQILLNLTGNAVKFTATGEILIEARQEANEAGRIGVRFKIVDTGVGIDARQMGRIFSSFTQADNSTTRQYGGTGLGTTISKQLVELMGGEIGVDSRPGQGSTFWFTVMFQTPAAQHAAPMATSERPASMTVLIVDQNATNRRILSTYLTHLGHEAEMAESGVEALSHLAKRQAQGKAVNALIVEAGLAEMDGLSFREHVRQQQAWTDIPLILSTNLKALVTGNSTADLGFDGSLSRPFKLDDLSALLAQLSSGNPLSSLPVKAIDAKSALATGDRPAPTPSGTILVVDDYPINQQVASLHLRAAGYCVDLAANGQQAVDAFKRSAYDLILMDIQMPVLNGYDAAARIRKLETEADNQRRIPMIALTANAMKGDEQKCLDAGMDGYLIKPVHRHQLLKTVGHWLDRPFSRPNLTPLAPAADTASPPETPILDTATAVEEFGDRETVIMVAGQLLDNVVGQLDTLRRALAGGDRERIRKEAHAIKGGGATMEAVALSGAAAHLEKISLDGQSADLEAGLVDLEDQYLRLREFVSQWKGS